VANVRRVIGTEYGHGFAPSTRDVGRSSNSPGDVAYETVVGMRHQFGGPSCIDGRCALKIDRIAST